MDGSSGKRAIFALFAALVATAALAHEQKIIKCCTEVSISNVTAPITGYRVQRKQPPCVLAIIFETTEGEVCSHWRQDWVISKVKELDDARKARSNTTATPRHKKKSRLHLLF